MWQTDEAATEQLRSWTTEILLHQSNNASVNKHNLENGEVKAEEHKGKVEEACKTQKPEGVIEKKMENGAGGLEATQAWSNQVGI